MVRPHVWHTIIVSCTFFLLSCGGNNLNNVIDRKQLFSDSVFAKLKAQPILYAEWLKIYKHKDTTFSIDSFSYVSQYSNDFIYTLAKLQKDYYKKYSRFFIYTADSDKFIDQFSNNVTIHIDKRGHLKYAKKEAEQEVAVVDVKARKRYRIFFCGSPCFISHACWITNDKIALIGVTTDDDDNTYTPTIWIIDMKKATTAEYSYTYPIPDITPTVLLDSLLLSKGITK